MRKKTLFLIKQDLIIYKVEVYERNFSSQEKLIRDKKHISFYFIPGTHLGGLGLKVPLKHVTIRDLTGTNPFLQLYSKVFP